MIDYQNDEQKRENLILFIKTTQKLMNDEGLQSVSIRKIAALSGFHNSTIYLYFKDLDELVMLASIQHFQKYSAALERQSRLHADPYDNFYTIWECFAESAFQYPDIFYNFFFGKHSDDLFTFLNVYYDLFPEEKKRYNADIEAMYFGRNYADRCRYILEPLVGDLRTCITPQNAGIINEITVSICKDLLSQKCADPSLDSWLLQQKLIKMLHFLTEKYVPV